MAKVDKVYNSVAQKILEHGSWDDENKVRTKYVDGTPATTKSILNVQMTFDNAKDELLLTTKKIGVKDPIKEILWIWQKQSNVVQKLRDMGCNVWNEWENKKGTIGKAYGWQLANKKRKIKKDKLYFSMLRNKEFSFKETWLTKLSDVFIKNKKLNQVDYLLYSLKKNPYSRRIKTTLYCVEDLDEMALEPCVFETHWQLWEGKLHLTVGVRSNDMPLGNPYNLYQYSILHRLIAQVTGHEVGTITFNIDNAHIYSRHIETIKKQISGEQHEQPIVTINPNVKSFYDFTVDDIKVENYIHNGNFKYEIAI